MSSLDLLEFYKSFCEQISLPHAKNIYKADYFLLLVKKVEEKKSRGKLVIWTIIGVLFVLFILLPLAVALFSGVKFGNVALIKINGVITADGTNSFVGSTVSSEDLVSFIEDAEKSSQIKAIVLEINSPGGSPVASDETASAVKKAKKPVIALIREVGASGGYWIASASDYIIANKMSITGSIGVVSSYLEFSGLMEKYGVGYEQLTAGEYKDIGTPYRQLTAEEKEILQQKINKIQDYFIEEISKNRKMEESKVRKLATGEFYLGSEALSLGLVDQLGDKSTVEAYLKEKYQIKDIDYVVYETQVGLLEMLREVVSNFFFKIGEGFGSNFLKEKGVMLT